MNVFKVVKRPRFAFPLACLATLAMVFISEASYWRSIEALDQLSAIELARTQIDTLTQSVVDAETGQRGYLLTGHKEYLEPYRTAARKIDDSFKQLERHYEQEAKPKELLKKLHDATEIRLAIIAETIRLYDEGKADAAKNLVQSGIGKEKMESIRALSAELLQFKTLDTAAGRGEIDQTLLLSRFGVAALSAFSLLSLVMYLRQTTALERQRAEQQMLVQAERDRLEIEVAQRTAQLTELTRHLQTAREDERSRLARDLHDELGALLTAAKLDAARIKSRLGTTAPEAQERLANLVNTLNSGIALKRRIIEDLRPSALSNLGLVSTLEILAREFAERSGVEVHCALDQVELEATADLVVYRVVQEAITNLSKYARAKNVWISLATHDGQVEVSVRDDGVGFDPAQQRSFAHGLMGMRFRVEAEGGSLTVMSAPGSGTLVRASLPESILRTAQQQVPG